MESKAWTVSVEPSDKNLEAPSENLEAPNFRAEPANDNWEALWYYSCHTLFLSAPRGPHDPRLGVTGVAGAACFCIR